MKTIAEVKIAGGRTARLLDTATGLHVAVFDGGLEIGGVPVKERTTEAVQQAIKEIIAMSLAPDRRPCPICGEPIATMEQANTNRLVLRPHGGTQRLATWQESVGDGRPRQKVEGGCGGSGAQVPRIVEVWRARGFGSSPAYAPTDRNERDASAMASAIVREGINSNRAAFVQRFDLPTQRWVTVSVVGNKNATYEVYDVKTGITSVYGINGKVSELPAKRSAERPVVTSLVPPSTFALADEIDVTLSDDWKHLSEMFGLRRGRFEVGINRVELIGSEAEWQKARDYVLSVRETLKGKKRGNATTALKAIDETIAYNRFMAAKQWGLQALELLPEGGSRNATKQAVKLAKSPEEVVAAIAAASPR